MRTPDRTDLQRERIASRLEELTETYLSGNRTDVAVALTDPNRPEGERIVLALMLGNVLGRPDVFSLVNATLNRYDV